MIIIGCPPVTGWAPGPPGPSQAGRVTRSDRRTLGRSGTTRRPRRGAPEPILNLLRNTHIVPLAVTGTRDRDRDGPHRHWQPAAGAGRLTQAQARPGRGGP